MLLFLVACGEKPKDKSPEELRGRYERLNPEERKNLAPNSLFEAIYQGDAQGVRELIQKDSQFLREKNKTDGDSPISVAIKLQEAEIANSLVEYLTAESLYYMNDEGNTYVYLAAQKGMAKFIESLSNKYSTYLSGMDLYDFSDLDKPNLRGETAIFVASNQETAEILRTLWFKGVLNFSHPYNGFYHHRDVEENTFLHRAALDNRYEVLSWARRAFCGVNSWQAPEKLWLQRTVGGIWDFMGDLQIVRENLFNRANALGDTPLHIAIRHLNPEAVSAIVNCEELYFDMQNKEGRSFLIEVLAALDPSTKETKESAKRIFLSLLEKKNRFLAWRYDTSHYVNLADQEGNSSLHWAARLADDSFYNQLRPFGDIYLQNNRGQTSEALFSAR